MMNMPDMPYQQYLHIIVQLLIIIGAINWLSIATYDLDFVEKLSMGHDTVNKGLKIAVGLCGVYAAYLLVPTIV
jgi:uncharacterized membrane protein YuzA (DUF378 family)